MYVTVPRALEESEEVHFPGIINSHIAKVAEMCSLIVATGKSDMETWTQLKTLVDVIDRAVSYGHVGEGEVVPPPEPEIPPETP